MPIRRGKERVGIIELLSRKVQPRDSHTIEMLKAVGAQISQFLDRKWAEAALMTERNLLRTLIDNLPDYIFAKDRQGRFLMNNLAHLQVLGAVHSSDVAGKTDLDFFPRELAELYHQDDQAVLSPEMPFSTGRNR
jgi:PAS domain-containing protein